MGEGKLVGAIGAGFGDALVFPAHLPVTGMMEAKDKAGRFPPSLIVDPIPKESGGIGIVRCACGKGYGVFLREFPWPLLLQSEEGDLALHAFHEGIVVLQAQRAAPVFDPLRDDGQVLIDAQIDEHRHLQPPSQIQARQGGLFPGDLRYQKSGLPFLDRGPGHKREPEYRDGADPEDGIPGHGEVVRTQIELACGQAPSTRNIRGTGREGAVPHLHSSIGVKDHLPPGQVEPAFPVIEADLTEAQPAGGTVQLHLLRRSQIGALFEPDQPGGADPVGLLVQLHPGGIERKVFPGQVTVLIGILSRFPVEGKPGRIDAQFRGEYPPTDREKEKRQACRQEYG